MIMSDEMKSKKKKAGRPSLSNKGKTHRATTRYPYDLWVRIERAAEVGDIDQSEWLRRAAEEKLLRD